MGDNQMHNRVLVCRIFCGCRTEALKKLKALFPDAIPFFEKIIIVRQPLEEQHKAAKFIVDYMKDGTTDSVSKVQYHLTHDYENHILRRQFLKNVEILEGTQPKPMPMEVLLHWNKSHLVEHMRNIERELSPARVFDHTLTLMRRSTGRKFVEIDEDIGLNSVEIDKYKHLKLDKIDKDTGKMTCLPSSILHLLSSDEIEIEVEKVVAFKSHMIRRLFGDNVSCISIKLSDVHSTILGKIIEFCKQHVAVDKAMSNKDSSSTRRVEDNLRAIGAEILNVDEMTLVEIIRTADFMEIPDLLDHACQNFAHLIEEKSPEEVLKLMDMKCFLAEENEPIKWESVGRPDMDSILKRIKQLTTSSEDTLVTFPFSKEKT